MSIAEMPEKECCYYLSIWFLPQSMKTETLGAVFFVKKRRSDFADKVVEVLVFGQAEFFAHAIAGCVD